MPTLPALLKRVVLRWTLLCGAAVVTAMSVPAAAQLPPLRDLPKPAYELEDPFSLVVAVRELRNGQLMVADASDAELMRVDFAAGTKTLVGRQGAGPGEYRVPLGLFSLAGDTLWVLDQMQQRIVVFLPNGNAGVGFPLMVMNAQDTTVLSAPFFTDGRGLLYGTSLKLRQNATGFDVPDSLDLVRFDPRATGAAHSKVARIRTAAAGNPKIQQDATNTKIKVTAPFPGLVAADAFTVFSDGRIAIVRGGNYGVEFIAPNGTRSRPVAIVYDRFPVTDADKKAEMDEVKRLLADQNRMMKKMMPPNITFDIEITPPPSWPAEFPPVANLGALAAPDGRLWVKRAVPARLARERWDVIDHTGKLVARWQLPPKTNLIGLGSGVAYTVRIDEDDLRYVQKIELPR